MHRHVVAQSRQHETAAAWRSECDGKCNELLNTATADTRGVQQSGLKRISLQIAETLPSALPDPVPAILEFSNPQLPPAFLDPLVLSLRI